MNSTAWRETKSAPCRSCGKAGWCQTTPDGLVMCRRVQQPGALARQDRQGVSYFLWNPNGAPRHHARDALSPPAGKPRRADADLLDRVYRGLLDRLPLSPAHRAGLRARGLCDDAIDRRGYKSLPGPERVRIARELAELHGDALLSVPGFHVTERPGRKPFPSIAGGGTGTLIPVRDHSGLVAGLLVRRDEVEPGGLRYFWLSSRKRNGPGPGCLCHVPLGIAGSAPTLRLTEGALKADISFELSGLPTIGLPSPGAWRTALPVLLALDVPEVLLALDADWLVNPNVAQALATMARALSCAGLRVGVELWDEPKGIDDLLAGGGVPEVRWLEGGPS